MPPKKKASRKDLEAVFFVADRPLTIEQLSQILELPSKEVEKLVEGLVQSYREEERGFQLRQTSGGYRLYTASDCAEYVEKLIAHTQKRRLTQAALETLAIVAYRQPITKAEISAARGVNSEGTIQTLVERGLIKEIGREDTPGQPILYGTTRTFLELFNLNSLDELPSLEEFQLEEGADEVRETPESSS